METFLSISAPPLHWACSLLKYESYLKDMKQPQKKQNKTYQREKLAAPQPDYHIYTLDL